MMLKFLPLTALAMGLSGGVALADRGGEHRGGSEHHAAPQHEVVRDHREVRAGGGVAVHERRGWDGGGRVIVRNDGYRHDGYRNTGYRNTGYRNNGFRYDGYRRVERRPIFVSRPIIRERYFNYYRRPSLIVESYNTMPGYYWVPGSWSWDGAEWIWQPGHYQPDASYVDPAYGYSDGY
jgi:hypothetical protein